MYPHSITWAIKLREMAAHSQKHHDILCSHTAGSRIIVDNVPLFSLTEQPEEKDEMVKEGLSLLVELENAVCKIKFRDDTLNAALFKNIQMVSNDFLRRLQKWQQIFDHRFVNTSGKEYWITCSMCSYYMKAEPNDDWTEIPCPLCGALRGMW